VIKIYLLFYMCHFAMGLTHCYKTTVLLHLLLKLTRALSANAGEVRKMAIFD